MTVNEYNYAQLSQTAKALAETVRHDRATEAIDQGKLAETQRHQMVSESIDMGKLDESIRHDNAMETIQKQSNYITDWYNRSRTSQEDAKIAQSGLSTASNVNKTDKETQWMDRLNEANVYATYTKSNAATTQAEASKQNASTNEFNAKVNAVLNTGKWITGTLTDLGGLWTKGLSTPTQTKASSNTKQTYEQGQTELEKYLESKGYWK